MNLFTIHHAEALEKVAIAIAELTQKHHVFCLYGDLGAGKTTLIKQVCIILQVEDTISSPTYPIINEYQSPHGAIYHIDLYRLKSVEEAKSIGIEEYLYSDAICFIEWPDNFENLIPEKHVKIFIRKLEDESRRIEIKEF